MPLNSDGSYTLSEEGTQLPVGKGSERYNPETGKFERVAEGGGPANGGPGSGNYERKPGGQKYALNAKAGNKLARNPGPYTRPAQTKRKLRSQSWL
jgi:hypothetical protein